MKLKLTLTAAAVMALSGVASAEQPLSMAEMDGVSAGGVAFGNAFANAFGGITQASSIGDTKVTEIAVTLGQLGSISTIYGEATAATSASADGNAAQVGTAFGSTTGTGSTFTRSDAGGVANNGVATMANPGGLVYAWNVSSNVSLANNVIVGLAANSNSAVTSASAVGNAAPTPPPVVPPIAP